MSDRPRNELTGTGRDARTGRRPASGAEFGIDPQPELALERDLIHRERLESLITGVSAEFIVIEPERIDAVMGQALQRIAEAIEIDHAYLCRFRGDPPRMQLSHEWCSDDRESAFDRIEDGPVACQPWLWAQIRSQEVISISRLADLPLEAAATQRFLRETGANSFIAVPLASGSEILGYLAFSERRARAWTPERTALLRFVGDIFVNAIERKEKDAALKESESRFRAVVENMPVMMEAFDADGNFVFWNRECERVTGYGAAEIIRNASAMRRLYPDPVHCRQIEEEWQAAGGNYRDRERTISCRDGSTRVISWSSRSGDSPLSGWAGWSVGIDVTQRHQAQEALQRDIEARKRAEELIQAQREILEMIALGHPLGTVLEALCLQIEAFVTPSICGVMLLDSSGGRLTVTAGPSLTETMTRELDGLVPGELAGSCGTAAYTGKPAIVADTSTDPRWAALREPADRLGIRACWSTPILSENDTVLGTFAIQHPQSRHAEPYHLQLLQSAAHVAGIAIQRDRGGKALEASEEQWRSLVDTAPDCILRLDPEGRIRFINRAAGDYDAEGLIGKSIYDISRPEDRAAIRKAVAHVLETGEFASYESSGPGSRAYATRVGPYTEGGRIVGVTSVARDITERRRSDALRAGQTRVLELLAAGRSLAEVLGVLVQTIEQHDSELLTSVFLLDEKARCLRLLAAPSLPDAYAAALDGLEVGLDTGPFGTACDRHERVVVGDLAGDPTVQEYRDPLLKLGIVACWAQPILDGRGRVLGLIGLHYRDRRKPTTAEIDLIETAARLAEMAIERRRAEQDLRDNEEAIRALHAVTSARDVGFDEQVRQLLALGCHRFDVEVGLLARVEGEQFEIVQAHAPADSGYRAGARLESSRSYCGAAIESPEPVIFDAGQDVPAAERERRPNSALEAFLGARVLVGDRVYGTLCFLSNARRVRRITEAETGWLQLMARWVGTELDHVQRRHDLELARFSVERSSDSAFWLDPAGRVVHANGAACQSLGFPCNELLSTSISDIDVGYVREHGWAALYDNIKREGVFSFESLHRGRDGRAIPVEVSTNYLQFHDREYVFAFARDITERKQSEATLREAEERYRAMFDQAPDAVVLVDPATGVPVEFNEVILRLLGYDREEFAALPIHHHEIDSSPERVSRRSQEIIEGGGGEFEMRLRTRDGDVREFIVNVRPIELSGRVVLHGVLHDITERKRAERVLRESEERFSKAFKSSPLPCMITDLRDGRLIDANDGFEKVTGYSREASIGRTTVEIGLWDDPSQRARIVEQLTDQGQVRNLRLAIRRQDRELRSIEMNGELVEMAGIPCVLTTAEDVTDRDHEADERERLESLLQHSQKMEALGQLAGGVAHDFNNILTAILGNTEMLMREADDSASIQAVRMRGQLDQVRRAGERAAGLTRQLLAFSRKQVRELEVLAPNRVISEMQNMMQRLIGENVRLECRLDSQTGRILADVGQLEQLVLNLAVNARDAMPQGGTLTIETLNAYVDEEAAAEYPGAQSGPHIRIRVRDTGSGISSESMERIFEPFFTTKPVGKGTGLGLATVYGIISQANGHVRVESQPEKGTVFDVWIPRVEAPEATEAVEVQDTDLRGSETVLVCEDEDMVRDLACRILRSVGYRVLQAENGRRALDLVRRFEDPIHLLLTDTIMPEMSGTDLARTLAESHPDMSVLYVSGYAPDVLAPEGVPAEPIEMLPKPFSATDLLKRVRGVLDANGGNAGLSRAR